MGLKVIQVSIIIINYNTDVLTLKAVQSVFEFVSDVTFEIIVVDNNSKETHLEELLSGFENAYFYKLEKNIGFGKANNFGFSKSKGKFIFLLNSDAYLIDDKSCSSFIYYLNTHPEVGCVGGNLITADQKPNICHGKFLSVERILCDYGIKKVSQDYFNLNLATAQYCNFDIPTEVDHLTGAAIMIKREVIEKYGLFNPAYFMYLEDMELCFRYKKQGLMSMILPYVRIVHIGGQSRKNNPELSKRIINEIEYSKYLFLKNTTAWPIAFGLFVLGKNIKFYRRLKRKIIKIARVN